MENTNKIVDSNLGSSEALDDALFESFYEQRGEQEVMSEGFRARLMEVAVGEELRVEARERRVRMWGSVALYGAGVLGLLVGVFYVLRWYGISLDIWSSFEGLYEGVFDGVDFGAMFEGVDLGGAFEGVSFGGSLYGVIFIGLALLVAQIFISRRLEKN